MAQSDDRSMLGSDAGSSPVRQHQTEFCHPNDIIGERFKVLVKLGEGGAGEVYRAVDTSSKTEVALKVEEIDEKRPNMEPGVLAKFQNQKHCPILYDQGVWEGCTYIAMQLLGKNLATLQSECHLQPRRFSLNTSFQVAIQCIEAVESLHNIGYLHRDIGPTNFAIGYKVEHQSLIYMLDYGLCRYYLKSDGSLRPRRSGKIGFRGTIKYASLTAHELNDLSRMDDMWSLFYMFFEFIFGQLPWQGLFDSSTVYRAKQAYKPEILCTKSPPELSEFMQLIRQLGFNDKPAYRSMIEIFQNGIKRVNPQIEVPLDWQLYDCSKLRHWPY